MSNRADLRERTKTMSRHGDRRGQIADFWGSFETINWMYLLFKCGIKTKTHFEWLLWHWSSLGQLNLEPTRPNGLVGCKVPTDLVKISVKEVTHMGFYYVLSPIYQKSSRPKCRVINWILRKSSLIPHFENDRNRSHLSFEQYICKISPHKHCCNWKKNRLLHCGLLTPYDEFGSGSTLPQLMACCLTAPNHYLNQFWFIIKDVHWQSPVGKFTRDTSVINYWNYLNHYLKSRSNLPGPMTCNLIYPALVLLIILPCILHSIGMYKQLGMSSTNFGATLTTLSLMQIGNQSSIFQDQTNQIHWR